MKASALAIGAVALGTSAHAQVTKSGNTYSFRMMYTKGQVIRQELDMKVSGPKSAQSTMVVTMKVNSVDSKGTAKVTVSTPAGMMMGQKVPANTVEMTMDAYGRTLTGGNPTNSAYPLRPMKIGDVFKGKAVSNGIPVDTVMKFTGIENRGSKSVAAFNVSISALSPMKVTGTGKTFINMKNGLVDSGTVNMEIAIPGQNGKPGVTMKIAVKTRTL